MDTLSKIFGSEDRVKIMRLFLFNAGKVFELAEVSPRVNVNRKSVQKELLILKKAGMLRNKAFVKIATSRVLKGKIKLSKKKVVGWYLNENFMYVKELQNLLINTILVREEELVTRLSSAGRIKFIAVSGLFLKQWDSRIDLLVVGDRLKMKTLNSTVRKIESEIGKEIQYAALEVPDFKYRVTMHDRLVRDIFDFPHAVLLDKLGLKVEN